MVLEPWASRYEADPAYAPTRVRELRSRWLSNSHRGRAQAFFVGMLDGQPAGYVTCNVDGRTGIGEIELVGTLPAFRGRRVASRVLEHALGWFGTRTSLVTVRTQATNIGAATLYERAASPCSSSDLTFRRPSGRRTRGLYENGSGHGRRRVTSARSSPSCCSTPAIACGSSIGCSSAASCWRRWRSVTVSRSSRTTSATPAPRCSRAWTS